VTHPGVEAISEHLEGTLDKAEDQRVREHLRSCAECTDRADALSAMPGLLRAAGEVPVMPEHLARRVDDAIAEEERRRTAAPVPVAAAAAVAQPAGAEKPAGADRDATPPPVADLDVRRRRRRMLGGGLLAAAAAAIVAVGLGDMLRTSEQPAAESAGSGAPPSAESLLQPEGRRGASDTAPGTQQAPSAAALPLVPAGLIADVAAAHDPQRPGQERRDCVTSALGSDAARTGASYAVKLPGGAGSGGPTPGVVLLRPNDAPTQAVLVACSPRPRVLDRRGLGQ